MKTFLVTIKLPRDPAHDPRHKKTGVCPVGALLGYDALCTDVTGAHHTVLIRSDLDAAGVRDSYEQNYHVTRVEEAPV